MRFAEEIAQVPLPALIPRSLLFGNPEVAGPIVSPDGRRIAWRAPLNGVMNIWVRTRGQGDDRAVTADAVRPIRSCAWQADSEHVLYVQDHEGDENWRLWQTNVTTGATRDLTPFDGVRVEGVADEPAHPDFVLVGMNLRDRRLFDMHRINLISGEVTLAAENPGDVGGFNCDHRLVVRAAAALTADGGQIVRVRTDEHSPWRTLMEWESDDGLGGIAGFTPDNNSLWITTAKGANAARLLQVDIETGEQRVLAEDPRYDVDGILTHPATHALEAVRYVRARRDWQLLDSAIEPAFARLADAHDGDISIMSRSLDDTVWTVCWSADNRPELYALFDRTSGVVEDLFTSHPALARYILAHKQPIELIARDGLKLEGYITLPEGVDPHGLPTILNVHGGPWGRDEWGLDPVSQWLANRGYAVVQINFRGSMGYGRAHLNAGDREWGGKMHSDLLDAKAWAIEQGIADPARVAIMGGSYGGYATLAALAFTPREFVCGVDIVGPSNLVTLLKSIPPYWEVGRAMFRRRVGNEETEPEFLESISPVNKAGEIVAPLLIAQGANDPRVKQAESDQIVAAMRGRGREVTYLLFPDEGHGFARPENRLRFYAAVEPFLAAHLGGRVEPAGPDEEFSSLLR
ncbi:MAG: S9 family peptidase [Armatimonadetes bacterium]|nr:S9 family peptidase [Armatimonadota bacterium]MDE2205346.1 S9 family peptidase [Armatimonadota bacterium]